MRAMKTLSLLICAALAMLRQPLPAQTGFTEIYAFGAAPDAQRPGGLVRGPDGALYGLSGRGGAYGYGTLFRLDPPVSPGTSWTETVLYSFAIPNGNGELGYFTTPVFGPDGALYGITTYDGTYGAGTAFQLQPPASPGGAWTETILFNFQSPVAYPSLVIGSDGTLYFATYGGAYGQGMIFALSPPPSPGSPWTEQAIYNFTGTADGSLPISLLAGPKGVLYGTTLFGGTYNNGVLFQLTPPQRPRAAWQQTVLLNFFIDVPNGTPYARVSLYSDGVIYGVFNNGQTLIQLQPATGGAWTQTVLCTFSPVGSVLSSQLILRHGNLYGATDTRKPLGGLGPGGGLFELQKPASAGDPWTEVILHHFQKRDSPSGAIVFDTAGVIYGTTGGSNVAPNSGYAYQLRLPAGN